MLKFGHGNQQMWKNERSLPPPPTKKTPPMNNFHKDLLGGEGGKQRREGRKHAYVGAVLLT